jgi:hypothetical protein
MRKPSGRRVGKRREGGRVECVGHRGRGEYPGEDEAQERIGRSEAFIGHRMRARIRWPLKPLKAHSSEQTSGGARRAERCSATSGGNPLKGKNPMSVTGVEQTRNAVEGARPREVEKA